MLRRRESRFRLIVIKTASLSLWVGSERTAATAGLIIRQGRVASRSLLLSTTEGKPQKQQRITYMKGTLEISNSFPSIIIIAISASLLLSMGYIGGRKLFNTGPPLMDVHNNHQNKKKKTEEKPAPAMASPMLQASAGGGLERKVDNVRPLVIAIYLSVSIVCVMCSAVCVCRRAQKTCAYYLCEQCRKTFEVASQLREGRGEVRFLQLAKLKRRFMSGRTPIRLDYGQSKWSQLRTIVSRNKGTGDGDISAT